MSTRTTKSVTKTTGALTLLSSPSIHKYNNNNELTNKDLFLTSPPSIPQSDDEVLSEVSGNTLSWKSESSVEEGGRVAAQQTQATDVGGGGEGIGNEETVDDAATTTTPTALKKPSATSSCCDQRKYCFNNHHGDDHKHRHRCYCVQEFYEEDEVARKNEHGKLEFGIVSRYEGSGVLKIFWTLGNEIVEEDLEAVGNVAELRLIDRLVAPGDIIKVNKKKGEVQEISWNAIIKLQENNSVLLDIPCERLEPLVPYFVGQKIVNEDGWIGTITRVFTEATLLLNNAKTTTIDCTYLPEDMQPYPGRKVEYTVKQYRDAGLEKIGGKKLKDMNDDDTIEAFVMFLNVGSVDVKWSGRVSPILESGSNTGDPPHSCLARNYLKKHVKVLGTPRDFDWDNHPEAVERFYTCNLKTTDDVLDGGDVEAYIDNKYFGDKEIGRGSVGEIGRRSKIMTNVEYVCRVLRFSRVVKVKWMGSGKVDKIRASIITWKHSFDKPFREIVQRKVSLVPYSLDEYGVTFLRDRNDTLAVKWFSRPRSSCCSDSTTDLGSHHHPAFNLKYQSTESVYDLEPHFSYGKITPGSVVYRSSNCKLPEPLFSIGWIRSITATGQLLVVSMHTKAEHLVFPNEVETTGIKIDGFPGDLSGGNATQQQQQQQLRVNSSNTSNPAWLVLYHGLYNLQISDQLFNQNLTAIQQQQSCNVPEHFKMVAKAPTTHTFYHQKFVPSLDGKWYKAVKRDQLSLSSIAEELATIWFKAFKDRPDLYSVLIAGVQGTPYEGGLFAFDIQLGAGYPQDPPSVHCLTLFSSRESCKVKQGSYNLELDDNLKAPYKLVESMISLQSKLFTSDDAFEIPSSAASLQRNKVKDHIKPGWSVQVTNMWTVIETLDLMYRNVFDPPHLWVNECLHYFKMSYERVKKKVVKMVDGVEGEEFHVQPVSEGWVDAVVARLKRIDELMGGHRFDTGGGDNEDEDEDDKDYDAVDVDDDDEEEEDEEILADALVHFEDQELSYENLLLLNDAVSAATATAAAAAAKVNKRMGEVAVENIENGSGGVNNNKKRSSTLKNINNISGGSSSKSRVSLVNKSGKVNKGGGQKFGSGGGSNNNMVR